MDNNNRNLIALLTGVAIGTGFGILFAPAKGKKIRKKIKNKALETKSDFQEYVSETRDDISKTIDERKAVFEKKLEDVISTMSQKADGIINSLENRLETFKGKNAHAQK